MKMKLLAISITILLHTPAFAQVVEVNDKYQKGQLEDGEKIGVWEYYGLNDELDLKVNHDDGTILYLKPDTSAYYLNINDQWAYTKPDQYARYLGSYYEFYSILQHNIDVPKEVKGRQTDHTIYLVFDINTDGQAENTHVIDDEDGLFSESILASFQLIPNNWIPASINQQKLTSRLVLPLIFRPECSNYTGQLNNAPEGHLLPEIFFRYYLPARKSEL